VSAGRADVEVKLDRLNPASRGGCATYGPAVAFSPMGFGYDHRRSSAGRFDELCRQAAEMRTINITISPELRFVRAFLISAGLLIAFVWRILRQGEALFSTKVGLASVFIALACLSVWGMQRATGQRWSWLTVFLAVCGSTVAIVWLTVAITRAVRFS
jgi:hypothetical protein